MNAREKLLADSGAKEGDKIELTVRGAAHVGILMPHHSGSGEDIITIKRKDGYNIGADVREGATIKILEKKADAPAIINKRESSPGKPTVAILGTGGTISSYVDYRTGAVHPAKTADELLMTIPGLDEKCNLRGRVLFSMFSEDMRAQHWKRIALEVKNEFDAGAAGVVVTHGTDTMGYTAAALSFMLRSLPGPVVLTGSQRSSDRPSTDADINLSSAINVAASGIGEVVVVMHASPSDSFDYIHRGTNARKMHTSRRDAFQSVNCAPIGKVEGGQVSITGEYKARSGGKIELLDNLSENVGMVHTQPGLGKDRFERITAGLDGVVLIGTGLGHTPSVLVESIKSARAAGTVFAMASQCIFGRVNMKVYSTGRDLLAAGVIPCDDMLPETAYVKLMWSLGQANGPAEAEKLMLMNIAGEMSARTVIDGFPPEL